MRRRRIDSTARKEVRREGKSGSDLLQDVINKRKALFDKMNDPSNNSVTVAKNIGTACKSRAEEIAKTIKDLEDRADKQADQIQRRLATFADKAEDIEHNDIAKELYALAKSI